MNEAHGWLVLIWLTKSHLCTCIHVSCVWHIVCAEWYTLWVAQGSDGYCKKSDRLVGSWHREAQAKQMQCWLGMEMPEVSS